MVDEEQRRSLWLSSHWREPSKQQKAELRILTLYFTLTLLLRDC